MKKRIISLMLSIAVAVTLMPVDSVKAAEINESEHTESDAVSEWMQDYQIYNVGGRSRVVGSNGTAYDEITYLSVDAVQSLDEEKREVYVELCDGIASWIEGGYELERAVIAVDNNGDLNWYWSVPVGELGHFQKNLSADLPVVGDLWEEMSAETESTIQTETNTDNEEIANTESDVEKESAAKTTTEEQSESESVTETETQSERSTETTTEEQSESESITETETQSESLTETTTEEQTETQSADETESVSETETASESECETESETETETVLLENLTELETETETETNLPVISENMEIMPEIIEGSYDVVEIEPAEVFIDLGGDTMIYGLDASLTSKNYFYNQLSGIERTVFNAGKGKLTNGSTSISFSGPTIRDMSPICQGISALILTYSDKFDWMDLSRTGTIDIRGVTRGSKTNYSLSISKSQFYSSSLEESAQRRVNQLAVEAQNFALANYPLSPAYGVIVYFDRWICENNFYNDIGVTGAYAEDNATREIYYFCHSAYGILLKGYGVCESYALSMSRLLDAVGITNMYVTGSANGGHAWNNIQMPDKKWYLHDSTWNDVGAGSDGRFLLTSDDGVHVPIGNRYTTYMRAFKFASLSNTRYVPVDKKFGFEKSSYDLAKGEKLQLVCDSTEMNGVKRKWSSSNTKVAKVSSSGKVTAVGPGTAMIVLTGLSYGMEMKASCVVNVNQVKGISLAANNKTSDSVSCGIDGAAGTASDARTFTINVDRGGSVYTTQQMIDTGMYTRPEIKVSNTSVATADYTMEGDKILVKVSPAVPGKTKITVKFAGKTATLNCTVGQILKEEWFDTSAVPSSPVAYTGKAYKPKVVKTGSAPKGVSYKVKYVNNKNAGKASVIISGTKKYGGEIIREFEITKLDITNASFTSCTKSKKYNGKIVKASTTVKLNGKKLTAGRDYDILYNGQEYAISAGVYTVTIQGKGNYAGTVRETRQFEIKK